jgi:hypothetical protein
MFRLPFYTSRRNNKPQPHWNRHGRPDLSTLTLQPSGRPIFVTNSTVQSPSNLDSELDNSVLRHIRLKFYYHVVQVRV